MMGVADSRVVAPFAIPMPAVVPASREHRIEYI
jgi:hypothetical protein